ncbi:IclR family transcriptional regulator [Mameliella sediminis]|uniref:IclR family transcriptional regulator n=1 Tax=Mameliella sediminis TaxID=2836866 RepID=UPI001C43BE5D|nr:IclR family transcriptional regulator [Mameliella sediminis]MBY6114300.1 IclR family transcriptional regulator [Antarctobacter heliothermus]MBY6143873.1 IclR family transcriptional regulator [Mameliella alba]MBY6163309.1 IclR family transcriptional regulator [Mameliella alba]MBY6171572.1 IclR family transcriptional regulator [Mameliella alba]
MQERLIQILEAIAAAGKPVSVNDLSGMTNVPRASIYRNIASLVDCGFVEESAEGGRYVLGMRFIRIALTGKSDAHVVNAVSSILAKLVSDLSETAFLARYRGGRVDLIHVEIPSDPAVSYIYPGLGPRPVHACSSAKAIAAFIAPEIRSELMDANPFRFTERTIVKPELIARELDQVRRQGFAICDAEIDEGVSSIAVPIIVDRLGAIFSIGVVGPSHRIKAVIQNRILPVLREEAVRAAAAIQHCSVVEAESTNNEALASAREVPRRPH